MQKVENALISPGPSVENKTSRFIWEPLMHAEAVYLEASLPREGRHASVAGFPEDVLKLDDDIPKQLRERQLEPGTGSPPN